MEEPATQKPVDRSLLEAGVLPLCDALNSLQGVRTAWSCEGHPWDGREPFVAFAAPREVAFGLHVALNRGRGDGSLHFSWWLLAQFEDNGGLRYILRPNDTRLSGRHRPVLVQLGFRPAWKQRQVVADLERLAEMVLALNRASRPA